MNFMICFLVLISLLTFEINAYQDDVVYNERDSYNRDDPDAIMNGFLPFWGIVLLILSGFFLAIAIFGLIGYLIGFQTPVESRHPSTDSTTPFFVIRNLNFTTKL